MKIFNLPDLGEGLTEAEIREWYVKEGDEVKAEQALCSVETAKAVVDVPSPHAGKVIKLYGKAGDIIKTGAPLIAFAEEETQTRADAGTVVGRLESSQKILTESPTGIAVSKSESARIKASPAVRALAKELNIDLTTITPTGPSGSITLTDVKQSKSTTKISGEALHGARRSMAIYMTQVHREVVPVTLMDYANIHHWPEKEDMTLRIIHAMIKACEVEPSLNAHFDGNNLTRQLFKEINLGLAIDTKEGLFVPVIKDLTKKNNEEIRKTIEQFKKSAIEKNFTPEDLRNATITLSNYGTIAGRYANPIIVLPSVAILGVGKASDEVVVHQNKPNVHRILPLSLTFDHRAVTGGEAARFLATVIAELQQ